LNETATFASNWAVHVGGKDVEPLYAKVPENTLENANVEFSTVPDFLRIDLRKPGILGKLGPRPILRKKLGEGASFEWLEVPKSFTKAVNRKGAGPVPVSAATEKAFRWYRLRRSNGSLSSAVATIIGGLLVALGAAYLQKGVGQILLIIGSVLTVFAAVMIVSLAWGASVD
jgi:hypothetical protein